MVGCGLFVVEFLRADVSKWQDQKLMTIIGYLLAKGNYSQV